MGGKDREQMLVLDVAAVSSEQSETQGAALRKVIELADLWKSDQNTGCSQAKSGEEERLSGSSRNGHVRRWPQ